MTITLNNKEYTITRDADFEYRSSRVTPENWVALYLSDVDDDETTCIAWYYVDDPANTELDMIDYDNPHDIELL